MFSYSTKGEAGGAAIGHLLPMVFAIIGNKWPMNKAFLNDV
tara:strand:+ start:781 stop:903 length:123 start_codon:yes stop_codon:yes gene_type:complete